MERKGEGKTSNNTWIQRLNRVYWLMSLLKEIMWKRNKNVEKNRWWKLTSTSLPFHFSNSLFISADDTLNEVYYVLYLLNGNAWKDALFNWLIFVAESICNTWTMSHERYEMDSFAICSIIEQTSILLPWDENDFLSVNCQDINIFIRLNINRIDFSYIIYRLMDIHKL